MSPADLLTAIESQGATLRLDGDTLKLRAPDGFPDDLRAQMKARRADLIGLLRTRRPTPREHLLSLADGNEEAGVTGRLGSLVTGELWLAVQRWESAVYCGHPDAETLERAYWAVWERHFPNGLEDHDER